MQPVEKETLLSCSETDELFRDDFITNTKTKKGMRCKSVNASCCDEEQYAFSLGCVLQLADRRSQIAGIFAQSLSHADGMALFSM